MEIHLIKTQNGKTLYRAMVNGATRVSGKWPLAVLSAAVASLSKKNRTGDHFEILRKMIEKLTAEDLRIVDQLIESILRNTAGTNPPPKHASPLEMAIDAIWDANEKQLVCIYVGLKDRMKRKFGFKEEWFRS